MPCASSCVAVITCTGSGTRCIFSNRFCAVVVTMISPSSPAVTTPNWPGFCGARVSAAATCAVASAAMDRVRRLIVRVDIETFTLSPCGVTDPHEHCRGGCGGAAVAAAFRRRALEIDADADAAIAPEVARQ